MVSVIYRQAYGSSRMAWSKGWQPPGAVLDSSHELVLLHCTIIPNITLMTKCKASKYALPNLTLGQAALSITKNHSMLRISCEGTVHIPNASNTLTRNWYQKTVTRNLHEIFDVSSSQFLARKQLSSQSRCTVRVTWNNGTELRSILCQKLVPHMQVSGTSFWYVCRRHNVSLRKFFC